MVDLFSNTKTPRHPQTRFHLKIKVFLVFHLLFSVYPKGAKEMIEKTKKRKTKKNEKESMSPRRGSSSSSTGNDF